MKNNDVESKINAYIKKIVASNKNGSVNNRMVTVIRLEILSMFANIVEQLRTRNFPPEVNVQINRDPFQVRVVLYDRETEEKITLTEWVDKCMERL